MIVAKMGVEAPSKPSSNAVHQLKLDACSNDQDSSPFASASVSDIPLDVLVTPRTHQTGKQQQQQSISSTSNAPGFFSRLLCCSASVQDEYGELAGGLRVHSTGGPGSTTRAPSAGLQTSWSKGVVLASHDSTKSSLHLPRMASRASSEYYDARSTASDVMTPQQSLTNMLLDVASPRELHGGLDQQQLSAPIASLSLLQQPYQEPPHWVPHMTLLFAPAGLKFVPVPAVTGFAGLWAIVPERSSPHPQPIDIMQGTNALVRKVHASVPGIQIEEDDQVLKFIANPSFMPKGLPSAHVETYDKSHATSPSWVPRRDLRLGSSHGYVYYTDDGQLVLRHETWGLMSRKPDTIVEDYLRLEEDDNGVPVIVDRMCCMDCKTGKRAEQLQVVRLVSRNPAAGGAQQK